MTTQIVVPPMGESVAEATVAKWLKKVGDPVRMDEPLVELETDKVTLEVNATAAGTISEIKVQTGGNVGVGAVLGVIQEGGAVGFLPRRPVLRHRRRRKLTKPAAANTSTSPPAQKQMPATAHCQCPPRANRWPRIAASIPTMFPAPARTAARRKKTL